MHPGNKWPPLMGVQQLQSKMHACAPRAHAVVAKDLWLSASQELLGPQAHRLRITISQQPSLLASSTETLIARREGLQELLGCDKATIGKLFVKAPSVGSADLDTIAGRIQDLTKGERAQNRVLSILGHYGTFRRWFWVGHRAPRRR